MSVNLTALQTALSAVTGDVEKKEAAFYRLLNAPAIGNNFTYVPNIKNGIITPTFKVEASIKPYSATFTGGSDETWAAKSFTIFENKIEHITEPKKYTKYWQSIGWVDYQGVPAKGYDELASRLIGNLIEANSDTIRKTTIWSGVRNGAGTTPADTLDGFSTLIAAAIISGDLPAGQIDTSSGAVTSSNVLDNIEAVLELVDDEYLALPDFQVLVSKQILGWAIKAYQAAHDGQSPVLIFDENKKVVGMYLDGIYSGIPLKMEVSMKTSGRIIATYQSNLQFGSNEDDFKKYEFDVQKDNWKLNLLASIDLGCGVYEFGEGAFACNDQT